MPSARTSSYVDLTGTSPQKPEASKAARVVADVNSESTVLYDILRDQDARNAENARWNENAKNVVKTTNVVYAGIIDMHRNEHPPPSGWGLADLKLKHLTRSLQQIKQGEVYASDAYRLEARAACEGNRFIKATVWLGHRLMWSGDVHQLQKVTQMLSHDTNLVYSLENSRMLPETLPDGALNRFFDFSELSKDVIVQQLATMRGEAYSKVFAPVPNIRFVNTSLGVMDLFLEYLIERFADVDFKLIPRGSERPKFVQDWLRYNPFRNRNVSEAGPAQRRGVQARRYR